MSGTQAYHMTCLPSAWVAEVVGKVMQKGRLAMTLTMWSRSPLRELRGGRGDVLGGGERVINGKNRYAFCSFCRWMGRNGGVSGGR